MSDNINIIDTKLVKSSYLNGINYSAATGYPVFLDKTILNDVEISTKKDFLRNVGYIEFNNLKHENIEMWIKTVI